MFPNLGESPKNLLRSDRKLLAVPGFELRPTGGKLRGLAR